MIRYDAIVVGAGPNGLAAAVKLAQAGRKVLVLEAKETIGGGARTLEVTLPGFRHDICSAFHPLGVASPFFRSLPLDQFGLEWIEPPAALAHPFDDGDAVILERSLAASAACMGEDAAAYQRLMQPLAAHWQELLEDILGPFPFPPRHPLLLARFGVNAIRSARGLAFSRFRGEKARAVFAGMAAHVMLPLDAPTMAAYGLVLGMLVHAVGWPIPKRGSQAIVDALAGYLISLGGEIHTSSPVASLDQLPPAQQIFLDVTPRQVLEIAGDRLPPGYRRQLAAYRYGAGAFKVDFALAQPIPWRNPHVASVGTVHLGGTYAEIENAEAGIWCGIHPQRPFTLIGQQSLFDTTRAPQGKHTAWAYCHVPHASQVEMTEQVIAQIERFAPGFRDCILAYSARTALDLQAYNPNYIGGDINGGVQDWRQLFTRPTPRWNPYSTPLQGVYLCSSATPPGGGVHGMGGFHAAQSALRG